MAKLTRLTKFFIGTVFCISIVSCKSTNRFQLIRSQTGPWHVKNYQALPDETPPGLSGLSRTSKGKLFSVAERGKALLQITNSAGTTKTEFRTIKIPQIPDGIDLEAIAAVTSTSAWIGTEAKTSARISDTLFQISWDKSEAKLSNKLEMPYGQFGKMPKDQNRSNRGIEGLCASANKLIVATELPFELNQRRMAAFGKYSFESQTWTPFYVPLLSKTGKISGISCQFDEASGESTIFAIERHYGVAQVLRITIPKNLQSEQIVEGMVTVDLSLLFETIPNLEGIVAHRDGSLTLISDNQSATVNGQAVLFSLIKK